MSHVLGMLHIAKEAKEDLDEMLLSPSAPGASLCNDSLDSADFQCIMPSIRCPLRLLSSWQLASYAHEHAAKECAPMESDAMLLLAPGWTAHFDPSCRIAISFHDVNIFS